MISDNKFSEAIEYLEKTRSYPHNLGEGKLFGTQENDINFWMGCAYEELGETSKSQEFFLKTSEGLDDPRPASFYNYQQPDKIFYQGLALNKLSKYQKAEKCFNNLISYGKTHQNDDIKIDYFAISLPDLLIFEDDLNFKNKLHCHYLMGLGFLGLNKFEEAEKEFSTVLENENSNMGAKIHLELCKNDCLKNYLPNKSIGDKQG